MNLYIIIQLNDFLKSINKEKNKVLRVLVSNIISTDVHLQIQQSEITIVSIRL